ncbi:hypothetical protein BGW80DRAFT_234520 [Lactifluus volemus]|nr:hypothetical protein BGW80DRAFT_234520 [Lactifluus volemus]
MPHRFLSLFVGTKPKRHRLFSTVAPHLTVTVSTPLRSPVFYLPHPRQPSSPHQRSQDFFVFRSFLPSLPASPSLYQCHEESPSLIFHLVTPPPVLLLGTVSHHPASRVLFSLPFSFFIDVFSLITTRNRPAFFLLPRTLNFLVYITVTATPFVSLPCQPHQYLRNRYPSPFHRRPTPSRQPSAIPSFLCCLPSLHCPVSHSPAISFTRFLCHRHSVTAACRYFIKDHHFPASLLLLPPSHFTITILSSPPHRNTLFLLCYHRCPAAFPFLHHRCHFFLITPGSVHNHHVILLSPPPDSFKAPPFFRSHHSP